MAKTISVLTINPFALDRMKNLTGKEYVKAHALRILKVAIYILL